MSLMSRLLFIGLVTLITACAPAASSPSLAPTTARTSAPSATPTTTAPATPLPTPSPTAIPLPNTAEVAAAGQGVAWMLVGASRLFRSTDRGDTWQERGLPRAPFANTEIAFVDDREGWLMASGSPATQCQIQTVSLYHTSDGAQTWQQLSASGIADPDCKFGLAFTDATHGYFSTYSPNAAPRIYRTADGGQTWRASQALSDPPG